MGTIRKDKAKRYTREYGVCRCGKSILSTGRVGTSWRHEDFERCLDGGWPKEAAGAALVMDLNGDGQTFEVKTTARPNGVTVGDVRWCQPEMRPRTLYRTGRITTVNGTTVTLEPLTVEELGDRDAKWNLPEAITLPIEWIKEKVK